MEWDLVSVCETVWPPPVPPLSDRLQHHYSQVCGLGQEYHGSHRTGRRLMEEQCQKKHDKSYNLQSPVLCTVYYSSRFSRQESSHHKSYVGWAFCIFYSLFVPHLATWSQQEVDMYALILSLLVICVIRQALPLAIPWLLSQWAKQIIALVLMRVEHAGTMTLGPHITRWPSWFEEIELARSQMHCVHDLPSSYAWASWCSLVVGCCTCPGVLLANRVRGTSMYADETLHNCKMTLRIRVRCAKGEPGRYYWPAISCNGISSLNTCAVMRQLHLL